MKLKFDLHIHSKYSIDGHLDPERIIETAKKRGLNGVAITDHDTIKGGLKAKKFETEDFKVIVGSEIATERGEIIGLFLNEEIKSRLFLDVLQEIKDQDGLVITPHPYDNIRSNGIHPQKTDIPLIDCIEVYNSRCALEKYNIKASQFAARNKIKISAGSDAHFASEIGNAGVIFDQIIEDPNDLINNDIKYFGKKSSFINLGLTEIYKILRQTASRF